jgi:hypothetical protein
MAHRGRPDYQRPAASDWCPGCRARIHLLTCRGLARHRLEDRAAFPSTTAQENRQLRGQVSVGELEDVGRFLAEIALSPEAGHGHDIGCRGTDHLDLAVVQRQFGTPAGRQDDVAHRRVVCRLRPRARRRFGREPRTRVDTGAGSFASSLPFRTHARRAARSRRRTGARPADAVPGSFDTFPLPPELSKGVHQFHGASNFRRRHILDECEPLHTLLGQKCGRPLWTKLQDQ